MDIWIIREGEKSGPIPDYEIRQRIETGELAADSPAWHEGLPGWVPLSQIPLFENEFKPDLPQILAAPSPAAAIQPPPIPQSPKYIRRFWARWLDIQLYLAIWWFFLWVAGRDIGAIYNNAWVVLSQLVPWVIIEILLIHYTGSTPGKWLLGIRVQNADGSRLDLMESTRRAARAYIIGIGLGWLPVSLFCMLISTVTTYRLGAPLWDYLGKHRLSYQRMRPAGIAAVVILFFAAFTLQGMVCNPYAIRPVIEQLDDSPESREMKTLLEQYQKYWSLPQRHP